MDWFHDLPTTPLAFLLVLAVNAGAILGLALLAPPLRRLNRDGQLDNSTIAGMLAAVVGIYSVAAALTAVAVWNNANDATGRVGREATALILLHHDLGEYPPQLQESARARLVEYAQRVIDREWATHLSGNAVGSSAPLLGLRQLLYAFEPASDAQRIVHAETLHNYNRLVEARRDRLRSAEETALPGPLWTVVSLLGALAIGGCYLLRVDSFRLHALVTAGIATPIALVVFFIAVTDRPFRGGIAVSVAPYQEVLAEISASEARQLAPAVAHPPPAVPRP
jgi:hypothetical protein